MGQSVGREEEDAHCAGLAASGPPCWPGPGVWPSGSLGQPRPQLSSPTQTGTHTKLVYPQQPEKHFLKCKSLKSFRA